MRSKVWIAVVAVLLVLSMVGGGIAASVNRKNREAETTTKGEETPEKKPGGKEEPGTKASDETTTEPVTDESTTEEPETKETETKNIDKSKPMVALTFDDGPYEGKTDVILDILEEHPGAAVTFFELGDRMLKYPEIILREEELGSEVGAHSYGHRRLTELTADQIAEDFKKQQKVFQEILGHDMTVYRPPYGKMNADVHAQIKAPLIIWTVDTKDWSHDNAQKLIETFKKEGANGMLDGKVVLMHSTKDSTVEAMKTVVPWLIDEGYQLVTVTDLARYGYDTEMKAGKDYGYKFFTGLGAAKQE
ncbi:MAG: polysaccharide deacetylase family protein [Lachnospiraceae bacterium]|nr:polysaccharide deacetylase family protein [Lachnospiraceae bacterium]